MKALHFYEHGGPDKLHFGEIDSPHLDKGDVLIRVKACSINHLDLWVLSGWPGLKLGLPHVGGADIAGTIESAGSEIDAWDVGDRVVVSPGYIPLKFTEDKWTKQGEDSVSRQYQIFGESRQGGFCEFVAAPAKCLVKIPDEVGFSEAAAPLLVGTTAWRMLKHRAKLQSGETVLIVGAGGGVNSISISIAKHLGANVIALTSSKEKMELAKALGADEVLNYKKNTDWGRKVKNITGGEGADVVVDNVGAKTLSQSLQAVSRGGRIVTVGNTSGAKVSFDNRLVFAKQISIIGSTMGSEKDFRDFLELLWAGKISCPIHKELPLSEGKEAYSILQRGEQFGKVVLKPDY